MLSQRVPINAQVWPRLVMAVPLKQVTAKQHAGCRDFLEFCEAAFDSKQTSDVMAD
jgi:hypothetical protein